MGNIIPAFQANSEIGLFDRGKKQDEVVEVDFESLGCWFRAKNYDYWYHFNSPFEKRNSLPS